MKCYQDELEKNIFRREKGRSQEDKEEQHKRRVKGE